MKKTKIIVPALGMLLLSTAASVTGTVAWFSANQNVSTGQMTVQAKAEDGIVIANEGKATWTNAVDASHPTAAAGLLPTSTANFTTWYHNVSNSLTSHVGVEAYQTLATAIDTTSGMGYVNDATDGYQAANDASYFLVNSFFIKSSSVALTSRTLYVNKVICAAGTGSANLDKSLRVGVVCGSAIKIFAPIAGATLEYTVADTDDVEAVDASSCSATVAINEPLINGTATIPANAADPLEVKVYIYFEGEDANCNSEYLTSTLDSLQVTCVFGINAL